MLVCGLWIAKNGTIRRASRLHSVLAGLSLGSKEPNHPPGKPAGFVDNRAGSHTGLHADAVTRLKSATSKLTLRATMGSFGLRWEHLSRRVVRGPLADASGYDGELRATMGTPVAAWYEAPSLTLRATMGSFGRSVDPREHDAKLPHVAVGQLGVNWVVVNWVPRRFGRGVLAPKCPPVCEPGWPQSQ